jgi:spore maturation protein CgeB
VKIVLIWPSAEFSTFDVAHGIRAGLVAEGHEVVDYRLYQRIKLMARAFDAMAPQGELADLEMICKHASEGLVQKVIESGARWVMGVAGMGLHPNALWALRRIGVKIAMWFTEAPYDSVDNRELHLAQFCDLAFVNERTSVDQFQGVLDRAGNGGRALYLRHAFDPDVHKAGEADPEHACDVLLVGTGFVERQALLEAIDWTGIDLRLGGLWAGIGGGFQAAHRLAPCVRYPCLNNRDVVKLYHSAKIVINPHRFAAGAESSNPRTWEVAACGAFQIADCRAEITEVLGDAVPTYSPGVPWQLAAMIRRYLADPAERRRLADRARERVQGETFAARAREIVDAIEAHTTRLEVTA